MATRLPKSEGMLGASLLGVAAALSFLISAHGLNWGPVYMAFAAMGIYALPQLIQATAEQKTEIRRHINIRLNRQVLEKLVGLMVVLFLVAVCLLLAGAAGGFRFSLSGGLLVVMLPALFLVSIPYVCTVHSLTGGERDAYEQVGAMVLRFDWRSGLRGLKDLSPTWFIKGFFFSLMFYELTMSVGYFGRAVAADSDPAIYWYGVLLSGIYFTDVCIAAAGYAATFRLFGWQIRSCSPFPGSWIVTLVCYYPFFGPLYRHLLDYTDDYLWSDWLATNPLLFLIWGTAIVALKLCWIWAIAPFGLRFSNLTNRGIMTNGAFRWSKHPSYISKNLFFWMIHVPFIPVAGGAHAVTNCLQLLAINAIYFARAKYEERHLSEEPAYVAYSTWVEENGLIGRLRAALRSDLRQRA